MPLLRVAKHMASRAPRINITLHIRSAPCAMWGCRRAACDMQPPSAAPCVQPPPFFRMLHVCVCCVHISARELVQTSRQGNKPHRKAVRATKRQEQHKHQSEPRKPCACAPARRPTEVEGAKPASACAPARLIAAGCLRLGFVSLPQRLLSRDAAFNTSAFGTRTGMGGDRRGERYAQGGTRQDTLLHRCSSLQHQHTRTRAARSSSGASTVPLSCSMS